MKKIILILVLFLFSNTITNAQIIEKNSIYKVVYSETYQQPISLSYTLPFYKKLKTISLYDGVEYLEPSSNFIEPLNIITSNKNDYEGNIYDHGHLAPNATFPSDSAKKYLWSYLNCALMHETLNSGVWRVLEDYERKLNEDNNVRVKIIVSFSPESTIVLGGATVPSSFTKIIEYDFDHFYIFGRAQDITREVYIFPNDASVKGKKIEEFKVKELCGKFKSNE